MGLTFLPDKFLLFNTYQTKNIIIVVEIPGLDRFSNVLFYKEIRYGDPGLTYGQPGLVYGGLIPYPGQRDILMLEGLNLSQKLEPEQGRASTSQISLSFIDKDEYMTKAVSPGILIPDIMGQPVKIYMGYAQISFPEDYFVVFRGSVVGTAPKAAMVAITLGDANIKKSRTTLFTTDSSTTTGAILSGDTTINVTNNGGMFKKILGPDGTYFSGNPPSVNGIRLFIKIDDEYIEYQQIGQEPTGFGTNQFINVVRGARGTTPAAHDPGADVTNFIEIQDHGVDMALSLMLSGWNGPFIQNLSILSFVDSGDPSVGFIPGAIVLPPQIDADQTYGIAIGDYLTVTGATLPANNGTFIVTGFMDLEDQPNRIITTDGALAVETVTSAVYSVRSQYDRYPVSSGLQLTGDQVDVEQHQNLKQLFLGQSENSYRFFISKPESSAKNFIEAQIYLPMATYSLTRYGRMSMGITKPPLADQRFQILDHTNILNAPALSPLRSITGGRKFFNEVDYSIDFDDAGNPTNLINSVDAEALDLIGISSVLPISSQGSRTDLNFNSILQRRVRFFLQRYSRGAVQLNPTVNWEIGSQIEVGDVVAIRDNGKLQITNYSTGKRDLGTQLFEVLDRQTNIKDGTVQLQVLGGVTGSISDRYATISCSSFCTNLSTSTKLVLTESFGALYPGNERKKWKDYVGLGIRVHSYDYTQDAFSVITGLDSSNNHALNIFPALPFTPNSTTIVDIDNYPTSTDPAFEAIYKVVHAFLDATVTVVSGTSNTVFDVSAPDASKFFVGDPIYIHNGSYSILSNEVIVDSIVGTTITVRSSLGFTPAAGQFVELCSFPDGGQGFRFI
jgi:hypothetical protein